MHYLVRICWWKDILYSWHYFFTPLVYLLPLHVQSNLPTTVSHDNYKKWPLLIDRWPLFRAAETPGFSRYQLRLAFVNRKPLLTGTLMRRFDCTYHFLCSWSTGSWHYRLLIYWLPFIIGANWSKLPTVLVSKFNNNSFYRAIHLLLKNYILYTIYSFKE